MRSYVSPTCEVQWNSTCSSAVNRSASPSARAEARSRATATTSAASSIRPASQGSASVTGSAPRSRPMSPDPRVPDAFDVLTVVVLRRPVDAPDLPDDELDALQVRHLAYRRELVTQGVIVANGPFDEQSDPSFRGMSVFTC